METAFVTADGRGKRGADEGGEGGTGGVDALDLVYIRWIDRGGEGADEDRMSGEGRGDRVVVETVVLIWVLAY